MLCSWLLRSSAKNRRREEGEQNTEQRTCDGKPEGNTPAGLLSGWICLHVIFSSIRRSTFHKDVTNDSERGRLDGEALFPAGSEFPQRVKVFLQELLRSFVGPIQGDT